MPREPHLPSSVATGVVVSTIFSPNVFSSYHALLQPHFLRPHQTLGVTLSLKVTKSITMLVEIFNRALRLLDIWFSLALIIPTLTLSSRSMALSLS